MVLVCVTQPRTPALASLCCIAIALRLTAKDSVAADLCAKASTATMKQSMGARWVRGDSSLAFSTACRRRLLLAPGEGTMECSARAFRIMSRDIEVLLDSASNRAQEKKNEKDLLEAQSAGSESAEARLLCLAPDKQTEPRLTCQGPRISHMLRVKDIL